MTLAPVQFYVPGESTAPNLPDSEDSVWPWLLSQSAFNVGPIVWTLYTYLILRSRGFLCSLVRDLPDHGIVVAHRDFLRATISPRPDVYLVCIKADRKGHSWANSHVVQNREDPILLSQHGADVHVMTHWPQPSLRPRNSSRDARCENLAYFGLTVNLEKQLKTPSWSEELRSRGLTWSIPSMHEWHDYTDVDVTVSIRSFGTGHVSSDPTMSSQTKPPSKLINSWAAGVPAIVGAESAYLAVKESDLDFLTADSHEDLLLAIERLRRDPSLYLDMVKNGLERSKKFSKHTIAADWILLFEGKIQPAYERWMRHSRLRRSSILYSRFLRYWADPENIRTALGGYLQSSAGSAPGT